MPNHIIHFTQEQTRDLIGVTYGDLRHWRKSVPYLALKTGKAARFSISDLVGLAVVGELVKTYGVRITNVAGAIDSLFRQLCNRKWAVLQDSVAVISVNEARLYSIDGVLAQQITEPIFVVPCKPIIMQIQSQVIPIIPTDDQQKLPFPPHLLKAKP